MEWKRLLNVQSLLWLALALALIGSLRHLAAIFTSVDGNNISGWIQAIAIDTGLFALSYSLRVRREQKRGIAIIWLGIAMFSLISIYGNLAYGFLAASEKGELPKLIEQIKPFVLAASLPVLVLYLAELVADNHQFAEQNEQAKASELAEQNESKLLKQNQPVAVQIAPAKAEQKPKQPQSNRRAKTKQNKSEPIKLFPCLQNCGESFATKKGQSGHQPHCKLRPVVSTNGQQQKGE